MLGEKIKSFNSFYLQIDESTDISGKCYLIGFVRFINNVNIIKQFFCYKKMKEKQLVMIRLILLILILNY